MDCDYDYISCAPVPDDLLDVYIKSESSLNANKKKKILITKTLKWISKVSKSLAFCSVIQIPKCLHGVKMGKNGEPARPWSPNHCSIANGDKLTNCPSPRGQLCGEVDSFTEVTLCLVWTWCAWVRTHCPGWPAPPDSAVLLSECLSIPLAAAMCKWHSPPPITIFKRDTEGKNRTGKRLQNCKLIPLPQLRLFT